MSFDLLFRPFEEFDAWLTSLFSGAPLAVALGIALLLGLRHAADPDHLVAVTSLVAARDGDARAAVRLGVFWGAGHAATLIVIGLPLIVYKSQLPPRLESTAETAIGLIILLLALRVISKWVRGDYRIGPHRHGSGGSASPVRHRHLRCGGGAHHHRHLRTPRQAFGIGVLHGVAGTGAVVLLLIAALPGRIEAAAALAVFAPASIVSMAGLTGAFAWLLTRPAIEPVYRSLLIPAFGVFGLLFGLWYAGVG